MNSFNNFYGAKAPSYDDRKFLVQCRNGHYFDFRNRVMKKTNGNCNYLGEGSCPVCGTSSYHFVDKVRYPVEMRLNE